MIKYNMAVCRCDKMLVNVAVLCNYWLGVCMCGVCGVCGVCVCVCVCVWRVSVCVCVCVCGVCGV